MSRFRTLMPLLPGLLCLAGCTTHHAPSFALMGAYFPSWMLCGSVGILIAIGARFLFIALGLDALLSLRLFTYVSLGVSAALLVWLIWFGA